MPELQLSMLLRNKISRMDAFPDTAQYVFKLEVKKESTVYFDLLQENFDDIPQPQSRNNKNNQDSPHVLSQVIG
jgi:hypothetical protein